MSVVRILEDRLVNKIAAGEVVERPASVVKELIENCVDAGAGVVELGLEAGGRRLIEVVDDGCGMDEADAMMCLERHGTSKIKSEDDLFSVASLGFRGEALPSIASVSRFELLTRRAEDEVGTRVWVDGGRLQGQEPAGCPAGTQIRVRQLFYNVPVRRKFLRTVPTELGHCVEAVTRMALIQPQVDFTVTHDGRVLLRAPGIADQGLEGRRKRAADLLGERGAALIPVQFGQGGLEVDALIAPVGVHQASAVSSMYLYVNGRFVADPVLRRAVRDAYRHIVPKGRHPLVVVGIRLPPSEVDVNVHPQKTEVRFRFQRDLQAAVADGLRAVLETHGIRRPVHERVALSDAPIQSTEPLPLVADTWDQRPWVSSRTLSPPAADAPASQHSPLAAAPDVEPHTPRPIPSDALLPVPRFQDLRVVGQLVETYLVCEGGGELVLIDQHAAHERITLHRLERDASGSLGAAQELLVPVVIDLPRGQALALEVNLAVLDELKIACEPMGNGAFAVKAVPQTLAKADIGELLSDIAGDLAAGGRGGPGRALRDHVLATMACHNSIRAHQRLSEYEMRELLKALDAVDFEVCAHGRPVAIRLDQAELERRFHRS